MTEHPAYFIEHSYPLSVIGNSYAVRGHALYKHDVKLRLPGVHITSLSHSLPHAVVTYEYVGYVPLQAPALPLRNG